MVDRTSARMAAFCTWVIGGALAPANCTALTVSLICSSVPGSCEATISRAPASVSAAAATRPAGCSAPITRAALSASVKSFSPSGSAMMPSPALSCGRLRRNAGRRNASGQAAAVDPDQRTVDVVGSLGTQKDGQRTDVVVLSPAAHRDELAALEERHQSFVVRKDAGHDAVGLNVELGVSQRHRARQLEHRALGACVHVVVLAAPQPIARCYVDNFAALLAEHLRNHRATTVELAGEVDVDTVAPFLVAYLIYGLAEGVLAGAGVVDEHVDFAELLDRRRHHRVH